MRADGLRVHAWVLMNNRYDLMVETPEGNLVAGMRWLQSIYTRRHKLPASAVGPTFRRPLQGDLERRRLGLLLSFAHGLHPPQSGAGEFGASEAWRKCARLYREQRGEGLCRAASSSTGLASGKRRVGHGAMCGHVGRSRRFVEYMDGRARDEGIRAGVTEPEKIGATVNSWPPNRLLA